MDKQLQDIAYFIQFRDREASGVSSKPVIWHLSHSLKVINTIVGQLRMSNVADYTYKFSFMRVLVLLLGYIPRGKAKAPSVVVPLDTISTQEVLAQLDKARASLSSIAAMEALVHVKHPILGCLHKKHAQRFLKIHTKHHLKIVAQILKHK